MNKRTLKRLFPVGAIGAIVGLAFLLPAGPLAAALANYGYAYSLGGKGTTAPAVGANTAVEDVFVRGTDNGIWHATFDGTMLSTGWVPGGGIVTADPGSVGIGGGKTLVFVRGTDNGAWVASWNGTAFSSWTNLGGILLGGIGAAFQAGSPGKVDIVGVGTDKGVWYRESADGGTTWGGWLQLGGVSTSDPAIVSWAAGRLDVFTRGTDNGIWIRSFNGTSWNNWAALGGIALTGPTAASCTVGNLDIFAVGTDHGMWHLRFASPAWVGGWSPEGNFWTSDPTAVCRPGGGGKVDYYALGSDGAIWQVATSAT